jgi:hypothetical protein
MANKKQSGDDNAPLNFEITPQVSSLKVNRERDQRVQWTTTASMVLSILLLISVLINVYQSISFGGSDYYAQDIRTSELTELTPLPPEERLNNPKIGKPPAFTEEMLAQMDAKERERTEYLNSLYRPEVLAARMQEMNGSAQAPVAAPVAQPAN